MSEIYIHYDDLKDSVKQAKKARDEIDDYKKELKKKIRTPISDLPGSDSNGYASSADAQIKKRISSLDEQKSQLSNYERAINNLITQAKNKDNDVSSQIGSLADLYIGKRTWDQKIKDWCYDTFCVDIPNQFDWTRDVFDGAKWIGARVEHEVEGVKNWFKYGDGRYILNIAKGVGEVIGSLAVTCVAIMAIPFTGGTSAAIAIGVIGAVAAGVSTTITVVNTESQINANAKALTLSDEHPGAARYYGNISSKSQEWEKTDMGDAGTNQAYKFAGKAVDTTKVIADTTVVVCTVTNSLGAKRDYRFTKNVDKQIKGYGDFSRQNIYHNLRGESGQYLTKPGIKDLAKSKKFISGVTGGFSYIGHQGGKIYDIWTSDKAPAGSVPDYDDPYGVFEDIGNGIGDLGELLSD